MDRKKNGNNGQQSPFGFGSASSTPSPTRTTSSTGSRSGQRQPVQMSSAFFGHASGSLTDLHHPVKGVYYSNPQTPTVLSPPPGFAGQLQNHGGILPPGYQLNMQNVHRHQNSRPQNCPQNFYPVGFSQQHIFNNFSPPEGTHHPDSFHSLPSANHQEYFSPHGMVNNENMYNNNVSHVGLELETMGSGMRQGNQGISSSADNSQKSGIKPLIDNIVGSMMFNGVNGAYTHFGPSNSYASADFKQHDEGLMQFGISSPIMPGKSAVPANSTSYDIQTNDNRQGSPTLHNSGISSSNHAAPQISGRSSTPSDAADNTSRPQTPNKPSYSEILAKNANHNGTTTLTSRKPPSGASHPTAAPKEPQTGSNTNTKKSDCTASVSSGSSANSSSCASLSSSPVAKQKSLSQTIMGRLFTTQTSFGKENTTVPLKATYSRTPSSTPTHQKKFMSEAKHDDRKILASQNSGNMKLNKADKFNKGYTSSKDLSELKADDIRSEGKVDGDWKTYSRNKHVARPAPSSKLPTHEPSSASSSLLAKTSNGVSVNGSDEAVERDVSVPRRESLFDKKPGSSLGTASSSSVVGSTPTANAASGNQAQRKSREKEKPKNKKDGRNNAVRRCERIVYLWAATAISALAWLLKLVTDVCTLSISVGSTLLEDLYSWWVNKAFPAFLQQFHIIEETMRVTGRKLKQRMSWNKWPFRRKVEDQSSDMRKNSEDLLSALGPDKNIQITNADETLKRLLSCKGQDPYSILGVRSDSSDETIRRYYKKQAVLVHPDKNIVVGAEEAFKILGRAFEFVGESSKRQDYHNKLLEAHAKEHVYGEIGKLLEQLRKKMEIATSSIRCTKCNLRHKKNKTDRPLFAARFCAQCNIHHAAREGELWAENKGWFGWSWNYFTCMDSHVWEINEWAKCQKTNLKHIKADSHCVMYRLVAGGGNGNGGSGQQSSGGTSHGAEVDPEDDWDSLINNLCKTGGVPGNKGGDHFYQQGGTANSSARGNVYTGNSAGTSNSSSTANGTAAGRKRKGKRK